MEGQIYIFVNDDMYGGISSDNFFLKKYTLIQRNAKKSITWRMHGLCFYIMNHMRCQKVSVLITVTYQTLCYIVLVYPKSFLQQLLFGLKKYEIIEGYKIYPSKQQLQQVTSFLTAKKPGVYIAAIQQQRARQKKTSLVMPHACLPASDFNIMLKEGAWLL